MHYLTDRSDIYKYLRKHVRNTCIHATLIISLDKGYANNLFINYIFISTTVEEDTYDYMLMNKIPIMAFVNALPDKYEDNTLIYKIIRGQLDSVKYSYIEVITNRYMNNDIAPLYVIDGLDGCGKTTQVKLLTDKIINVIFFKFPDRTTPTGKRIDDILNNRSSPTHDNELRHLFFLNRLEKSIPLQWQLLIGMTVICDRYIEANAAYNNITLTEAYRHEINENCLPEPRRVIYLKAPIDELNKRLEARGSLDIIEQGSLDSKINIMNNYDNMAHAHPHFITIDATRSIEDIHEELVNLICD